VGQETEEIRCNSAAQIISGIGGGEKVPVWSWRQTDG
jgi:hypothetical protein